MEKRVLKGAGGASLSQMNPSESQAISSFFTLRVATVAAAVVVMVSDDAGHSNSVITTNSHASYS